MRNLVLPALFLAAVLPATGCIFVSDDDDDDPSDDPSDDPLPEPTELNVTWSLVSGEEAVLCRPGANPTVTLYACPGDCPQGTKFDTIPADCPSTEGSGTISVTETAEFEALPAGNYTIWVEFESDGEVYAKSFADPVTLTEGGVTDYEFEVQIDHGFFDVAWTLVDDQGAVECSAVKGAVGVGFDVTFCDNAICDQKDGDLVSFNFPSCDDGSGRGGPVAFNGEFPYSTSAQVIDAKGSPLTGGAESELVGPFEFGNEAISVGTLAIPLD